MEPNGRAGGGEDNDAGSRKSNGAPKVMTLQRNKYDAKIEDTRSACKKKDTGALRELATTEGGLISDDVRREAWPLLLGGIQHQQSSENTLSEKEEDWRFLPRHDDEDQVRLDVDRSFIYYPNNQSPQELEKKKTELSDLITEVLRRQPYLRYFQGYHDICQVFLLVLQPHRRVSAVARLSTLRIRDFMLPKLAPALAQLRLIPAIINAENPKLSQHLPTQPFFALSGTLTMYAHDIQEYGDIARLFDALLAREAVFSVYMFAQIVLQRADELFETPADEPEMLHSILSKLPKPLELENLISKTIQLMEKHPPECLRIWSSISSYSVLKTARGNDQTLDQSVEDGKVYFYKQVKELEWVGKRQKIIEITRRYGKSGIGLAVAIAVLAYWLKRQSGSLGVIGTLWRTFFGQQGL